MLTLNLSDRDSGLDVFIARSQVAMVDMPLHRMSDAAKRERGALEREDAQAIAEKAVSKATKDVSTRAAKKSGSTSNKD
jgi:negative regulator of genetic competence, sporulation and motility